jgi:hypothetical protein
MIVMIVELQKAERYEVAIGVGKRAANFRIDTYFPAHKSK